VLRLDIHFLTGVFRAATIADKERAEWPPHPDRIFSALVCAWAENGREAAGEVALAWLERLPPPLIEASGASPRDAPTVFVPPNDDAIRAKKIENKKQGIVKFVAPLEGFRPKQERFFPTVIPDEPMVRLWWKAGKEELDSHLPALDRIARSVGYLGHSASLVSMRFLGDQREPETRFLPDPAGRVPLRIPYEGRLEDLIGGYEAAMEQKHRKEAWRPEPAPAVPYRDLDADPLPAAVPSGPYGRRWLVLAGGNQRTPALEAFATIAEAMRNAVLAHAGNPVPSVLSGHEGASVLRAPHLAILPMANVGFDWSDGRLFGLALVLPREHDGLAEPIRVKLEEAVARFLEAGGTLALGRFGTWTLLHDPAPERASLRPGRYLRTARRFASVTPLVLPRHMKRRRGDRAEAQIALACRQQGLPEPEMIEAGPHPFLRGTSFASKKHWHTTGRFASRTLVHARLTFAEPVRGPLLLGAGRHFGLGLMLPLPEEREG